MRSITDKLLLILCCCIFCKGTAADVAALMITVTFSALCQYSERSRLGAASGIACSLLCLMFPAFTFAMPLIIYDISKERYKVSIGICAAAYLMGLLNGTLDTPAVTASLCGASVLLQHRTTSYEKLYDSYIKTVDSSTEVTRLLEENNLKLIENKNYEIRLATLNERNRIAREIHDNVGHMLSRSILQVQALKLIPDDELRKQGLTELGETLGNAMTSIRKSVHDLHDDSIDIRMSMNSAVAPLKMKGIDVSCECSHSNNVPNNVKLCVVGIVKEAASNIIKHSSGDAASFIFREQPAFYQLIIEDNGKCSEEIHENGIGLSNMRMRVEELGGIINITSGKKGFRIFISVKKV